jgi:HD-GYP domain-containing protein (c-di-GMP phosphodiesterase class II)
MNAHSFETYQILKPIPGFDEIALWAAYHHESPGGDGYPFRISGEHLSLEARILRVADIFQAMAQDRPYRAGLPAEQVSAFMQELAGQGRVDAALVSMALSDLPAAMAAARPGAASRAQ